MTTIKTFTFYCYAPDAANAMKLDARSLKRLGVIDKIIKEPMHGAHTNPTATSKTLKSNILEEIKSLSTESMDKILEDRYKKYRRIGEFIN